MRADPRGDDLARALRLALGAITALVVGCAGERDAGPGAGDAGREPMNACGPSEWPESGEHTLDVNGVPRTFIVRIPDAYDPDVPYQVVLAWHGFTGTAAQLAADGGSGNHARFFGLEPLARGRAIFVAGQGLDTTLLGQTAPGWGDDGRDIAFVRALLDWLRASYCIDDAHVYSVGVSMGGYFSNQVGCELSDQVRAVASIFGGGPLQRNVTCTEPMAAWLTHGEMDVINPFSQGEASRDHWIAANHCASSTTAVAPSGCVAYEGCDDGFPVHWCPFEGGHAIPDFAAEGIWAFFSQL